MEELTNISPIDGRYKDKTKEFSKYFSEYALIKKRVYVELEYIKELGEGDYLEIYEKFDLDDAKRIKEIEKETNHDIKAIEYFLREKLPKEVHNFIHYGITSEDINNLAYSLLIKDSLKHYSKKIEEILSKLMNLSIEYKKKPMLARTHGQAASPTTVGKEFFVFFTRIKNQLEKLKKIELTGKFNGATGNYNALYFSENIDWLKFSKKFIERLGLKANLITTQVEPKDNLVELIQCMKRINNIIIGLNRDMWIYISYNYFKLRKIENEVGSSTMPHKINPIDFENSEGNLKIANSLFTGLEDLQISRLQRDLSDSTMMRNIGVAFSHSIIAYCSTLRGLDRIEPDFITIDEDIIQHPEVIAEAIQTILRKNGDEKGYEKLKVFTRGKKITLDDIREFIKNFDIPDKDRLLKLEPKDYIGLAFELVKE